MVVASDIEQIATENMEIIIGHSRIFYFNIRVKVELSMRILNIILAYSWWTYLIMSNQLVKNKEMSGTEGLWERYLGQEILL